MQKFNSISDFIDELEFLADNLDSGEPIESTTNITSNDFISNISFDEWEEISDVIDSGKQQQDPHAVLEYIYEHLSRMGYSDDEILEITNFCEEDL